MEFKVILCPVDLADFDEVVNRCASGLAESNGSRIVYLNVAPTELPYDCIAGRHDESEFLRRLQEIRPTAEGIDRSYVVRTGKPSGVIVQYANDNQVDLIAIGTHGRTGVSRMLMGSVAEAVVRNAECPVMALGPGASMPQKT